MILARYLLTQTGFPFLFGLALFSGVLTLDKLFDILDLLINKGVSLLVSARIFSLFLPAVLTLSVPMSALLACLLAFGRMSEDNEVTALRASGLSFLQILWPPLLAAALLSTALVPFNGTFAPRAMAGFRTLQHEIASADPLIKIEPGQFTAVQNMRLYARRVDRAHDAMMDVWLYQTLPDGGQRVYARRGTARATDRLFTLHLQDGQIDRFSRETPAEVMHIRFQNYTTSATLGSSENGARGRSWREMEARELRKEIAARRASGQPAGEAEAEYHMRIAMAWAPLFLAFLGIPLGVALERGGRGVGLGASVAVIFVYYLLLIMGVNLAEKGAMPAGAALWMANAASAAAGIPLYWKRLLK